MRRLISAGVVAALLLAVAPVALGVLRGLPWSHGEAATSMLTCSVKASCDVVGEVAVFRISGLANAHAQTAAGSTYGNVVCCGGPAGLSAACNGHDATVLKMSAADNAHVAEASDMTYTTEVCLSADIGMNCQYGSSCGVGYACLATISDSTNAHVADCNGTDAYATKVCCAAQAPGVGGIAELPDIGGASGQEAGAPADGSGWSTGRYAALAGGMAAATIAIAGGGWYARRRWVR